MDDNTHVPSSRVMSSPTFQQQRQQMNPEPSQHSSWTQAPLAPLLEPTSPSLATTIPFELRDQHQQQNHHHHHQQQHSNTATTTTESSSSSTTDSDPYTVTLCPPSTTVLSSLCFFSYIATCLGTSRIPIQCWSAIADLS
ncbi:hypothetical protein BASA50_001149 [Batrachochytrium salamandrivorans]|uniref:Uncharacterized protein n=1 Tax=Batrachochytrium salamandrivorans TaxID=1357716 RepID=A0ABQ8EUR6_9FUNG|nr:hypothetical protein BASA50_001149 [Batrachochytrium salamandrivorans]